MLDTIRPVEVSVVVIEDERGRILLDFNERWAQFTLPMSKVRLVPATPGEVAAPESRLSAALRAAAEVLGRPHLPGELEPVGGTIVLLARSGRTGRVKTYHFHAFTLATAGPAHPLPGHVAVWLTGPEVRDREPISPTVGQVLDALAE